MNRVPCFVLTALIVSIAVPRVAHASDPQAEALYQEGRRAARDKDWATACAKFRASNEREPAPGTFANLADCEEKKGDLLEARAHFETAARMFKAGDERVAYARQRAADVDRRVPKLTLRLHATAAAGTVVERDGEHIDPAFYGRPVPLNPGEHTLVVRAPGHTEVRSVIRMIESESREIELVPGMVVPDRPAATASSEPAPQPVGAPAKGPDDSAATPVNTSGNALRTAGFVSLGVGGVGLGLGLVAGLITANAKSTVESNCTPLCNSQGLDAQNQGKTWGTVSTAAFIAGGVGVATGAVLLFAGSSGKKSTTQVGAAPLPGGALVGYGGTF